MDTINFNTAAKLMETSKRQSFVDFCMFVEMRIYLKISWLLFLILPLQIQANEIIQAIYFNGLKKTDAKFLHRFIECQVGNTYDSLLVEKDIQALRNLQLFEKVSAKTERVKKGINLYFECKEVITIIPFLDFGGVKGNLYFQVGTIDFNWLGKGNQLGGFYRYDGRHSAQLFLKKPYIKGSNWGVSASALKLSTVEPLFFTNFQQEQERVNFYYDNFTFETLGRYEFSFGHFLQFGGAYLYEKYSQKDDTPTGVFIPPAAKLHKGIIKMTHTFRRLDYYYHYISGFSNELSGEIVINQEADKLFWKFLNITKYFKRIGKRGNFATRLRLGLSPNTMSPFVPFVMDSYVNIRGSGNRVARGTGEVVLNTEYRHSIYENFNWGAIQGVGFVDVGTWRLPKPGSELFNPDYMSVFYGVGARIYFSGAYNFILRIDYGRSGIDSQQDGFVLGVGQYF